MALIKSVRGFTPEIGENCFLADNATIIGDVKIGDDCSIWFCTVLRGDVNSIRIGNGVNIQDEKAMSDLMDTIDIHFDEDNHVYLDGEDVSKEIRMNNVSMQASKTSQLGIVRKKLVNLQQKVCASKGFIVDGRDICSVVLPDAEVKIFMSASSKARAQRRYDEYISKGIDADYETIYQDIVARDYQDMHREISPLVKTEDAIEIDTSDLTIDEVVSKVLDIVG